MANSNNSDNAPVRVVLDNTRPAKPWRGFGSTVMAFREPEMTERPGLNGARAHGAIPGADILNGLLDMVYREVRLNRARVFPFRYERRADAAVLARPAADWTDADFAGRGIDWVFDQIDPARERGLSSVYGSVGPLPEALREPGVRTLRRDAYAEYVERVIRVLKHWRDRHDLELEAWALFNEPHYPREAPPLLDVPGHVELTRLLGRALEAGGFRTRVLIADDWAPRHKALEIAEAVLSDQEARSYVCAVGYHNYDGYDFLNNDRREFADQRKAREEIRALCEAHGVEAWMTELSHYRPTDSEWRDILFMANGIMDDLIHAGVTAWDFMLGVWQGHWRQNERGGPQGLAEFYYEPDGTVRRTRLTRVGAVMGHWSRVIAPGWRQIPVKADSGELRATAFLSPDGRQCGCVIVNNGSEPYAAEFCFTTRQPGGGATGFRTNPIDYWGEIAPVPAESGVWRMTINNNSMTTLMLPVSSEEK